ncbi:menaquinone-dependent protoporphyrinogen IX oxidase [Anaerotaenia torta]|uniref:flavodoxin domain-containing protein n=1 Tax=Anaerotaenia torta TaxID=433293 RepID=UPI003D1B705D
MQKAVVIYKSKTGFTKKYAQWIGEELNCVSIPYSEGKRISLEDYDIIIFGGGLYAGMINGLKWFKGELPKLHGKKVAIFATGATPPGAPDIENALKRNFTEEELNKGNIFYLQSGLCYERMSFTGKLMMALFRKMLKKTEGEDSEAYRMVQQSYDYSSKDAILLLTEYCKRPVGTDA